MIGRRCRRVAAAIALAPGLALAPVTALVVSVSPAVAQPSTTKVLAPAEIEMLVAKVEAALTADLDETAAELLPEAEAAVARAGSASQRSRWNARLLPARKRVGDNLARVQRARGKAAGALLEVAASYARRGWTDTAAEFVAQARALDPTQATAFVARVRGLEPTAAFNGVGNQLPRLFAAGRTDLPHGGPAWRLAEDHLFSPSLPNRDTVAIVSTRALPDEYEASARIRFPAVPFKFALLFGYRPAGQYYIWQVVHEAEGVSLRLYDFDGDRLTKLHDALRPKAILRPGTELTAAVSARGIRCTFGPVVAEVPAERAPRQAAGGVGFFVSGDSTYAGEVEIESLRVDAPDATKR